MLKRNNSRILLLKSRASQKGGLEKYTWRLAHAFREKGAFVTLLTTGPIQNNSDFEVVTTRIETKMSFRHIQKFDSFCTRFLEQNSADIVFGMDRNRFQTHLRAGNGVHAAYLKKRSLADPVFKRLTYKINPLHRLLLQIEKESFEHQGLQKIFANSHMVKEEILAHYAVQEEKIEVVHNGVEWKEYESHFQRWQEEKEKLAIELGINRDSFHFLFVGNNFRRKGLSLALEALALLPSVDFHLTVVGKDKDQESFEKEVQRLKLEKKVLFVGLRSDVPRFYQLADALIIPSHYDPFSNVTVEALAMGVFVVSSLSNGGHEVLTEANGIKIANLSEKEAVLDALKKALEHRKSDATAKKIRASVEHLDFSSQLGKIVQGCHL